MLALQGGDEQAFDCLLDRHLNGIHAYLRRQLGNTADADELSQETFTRLWTDAHRFNPNKAGLRTWLHRIAHNLMIDQLRTRRTVNLETAIADAVDESSQIAAQSPISEERQQWLSDALTHLPAQQRAALALVFLQGFSNQDAAIIMGISLRAVESQIARGKRALKKMAGDPQQ